LVLLVKRLLVLHGADPVLKLGHLPERMLAENDEADADRAAKPAAELPELSELVIALRASGGNVAQAAAALGISRQRAYRMMQGSADIDLGSLRQGGSQE
jgi:transcriptional regulator of acetoin/glycerol metabolism